MSKLSDKSFPSRQEANFAFIMNRIRQQDKEMGGVFTESTGMQGASKTAAMLSFLEDNMIRHPDQKNFWRNTFDSPLQFTKLKPGDWELLIEKDTDITFYERKPGLPTIDLDVYTKRFSGSADLYEKATPGKCSAVFFKDETTWYKFLKYLRKTGEWSHVFLDEYGELFPANPSGVLYRMLMEASLDLGEVRKCFTNVHATTQVTSDVDYRIRGKIMIFIYFPGARVEGRGLVKQIAVNCLEMNPTKGNQAWLELRQHRYGKGRFTKIYKPKEYMDWAALRPENAIRVSDYLRRDFPRADDNGSNKLQPQRSRGRPRKQAPST